MGSMFFYKASTNVYLRVHAPYGLCCIIQLCYLDIKAPLIAQKQTGVAVHSTTLFIETSCRQ